MNRCDVSRLYFIVGGVVVYRLGQLLLQLLALVLVGVSHLLGELQVSLQFLVVSDELVIVLL